MWERLLAIAGFEDGNGPQTKECEQPIERGISKNTFSLEPVDFLLLCSAVLISEL